MEITQNLFPQNYKGLRFLNGPEIFKRYTDIVTQTMCSLVSHKSVLLRHYFKQTLN